MSVRSQRKSPPAPGKSVWLSRAGEKFGPYTADQVEEMRASGEYYEYEYSWDGSSPDWAPIEPTQGPPPPAEPSASKLSPPPSRPKANFKPRNKLEAVHSHIEFQAVCHNSKKTVSGKLIHPSQTGGILASHSESSSPAFTAMSSVWVNLLDESTDRSVNVRAKITKLTRQDGVWFYELRWDACPLLK